MKEGKKIEIKFSTFCIIAIIFFAIVSGILCAIGISLNKNKEKGNEVIGAEVNTLKALPKPEITGGTRGELGIDKNINEETIDEYLNREDSVYRDMRMLEDPGNYESIGGDRFLSGYIKGFEVIPLPYIIPVTGLPSEVGDTYTGTTLFYNDNGTYVANYEESMKIIERVFPKDKVIFLMCGGGGYAGMTKNFLISLGWDENKIYNVGGYWYYKGNNNVNVKKEVNGVVSYDFDSVPYCNIEFAKLTKSINYKAPIIKVTDLKLNTSKIELEEDTSFKLNVIVLPNEATNKEVKWSSSNEAVATVTNDGLVKAIGAGNAIITVKSLSDNKSASCEVVVNKKVISTKIKLDDLSKEAEEFASYDLLKIVEEFAYIDEEVYNNSKNLIYHNLTEDGGYRLNELGKREYEKKFEKIEEAKKRRLEIFNSLIDNKKSFIIVRISKDCDGKEYLVYDGAEKILKQNNYIYFKVGDGTTNGEETLDNSNLDLSKFHVGSVGIIQDGEIYASIDSNVDSIKNDEDTKNWLNKYISVE